MTSLLALNARLPSAISRKRYLKADKEGVPLDKQVPRTYQVYEGTGGETIDYDGSSEIVILSDLPNGPLTVALGQIPSNLLGRWLTINVSGLMSSDLVIDALPALLAVAGTQTLEGVHTITGDRLYRSINIFFANPTIYLLEGGVASATSSVSGLNLGTGVGVFENNFGPTTLGFRSILGGYHIGSVLVGNDIVVNNTFPSSITTSITYPYGNTAIVGPQMFLLRDTNGVTVTTDVTDNFTEGRLTVLAPTTFTGPGPAYANVQYIPPPRQRTPVNITINLTRTVGGQFLASSVLKLVPNTSNVFNIEYITGTKTNGNLEMYQPTDNATERLARDQNGITISLPNNLSRHAMNIADNLVFYTLSTSQNIIRWFCFSNGGTNTLLDISKLATIYTAGSTIVGLEYVESQSLLLVLTNNPSSRIIGVPIVPYDPNLTNTLLMGPVSASASLGLVSVNTMHSISVCPSTQQVYISYQPTTGNIVIGLFSPYPNMNALQTFTVPVATGGVLSSLVHTTRGRLVMLLQTNNSIYTTIQSKGLLDGLTLFGAWPAFYPSLSRNGYGQTQL